MRVLSAIKYSLFLLIICAIGWFAFSLVRESQKGHLSSYKTKSIGRMDLIQRITITGSVVPERKTVITAPFNGYVKKLYVKIGDKVQRGAPIVSVTQSLQSIDPAYPLRAPFPGTVVQVAKEEGEFVKQNDSQDYLVRIDKLDKLYIKSNIPEIDRLKIKLGQEAVIKVSAILNKQYKGRVEEIFLASKQQSSWRDSKVEFPAKIRILNFDGDIKSGMSAVLDIITFKQENVLGLPHEFILKRGGDYFVILKDGSERRIEVGLQNEQFFEVARGLEEGDEVRRIDFLEVLQGQTSDGP